MKVVRQLDEHRWREFVDNHPEAQVFHTPEMYEVFARTKGYWPALWATVDSDGSVLALLLPVYVTIFGSALRGLTTRSIVYGGALHVPEEQGLAALSRVLTAYKHQLGRPPLYTELRNLSDTGPDQAVLQRCGFAYEGHLNYLMNLQRSPESILQGIGTKTRKHLRRALRQTEVGIEEVSDRKGVGAIYGLLSQTYQAARVPLADRSLFEAALDVLYPKGMTRFTLARVGDEPAAASVELLYKDVVYDWYGGTNRAYSRYLPNELLIWSVLEWGASNGYKLFDFGGAGKPDEEYGVRDFKAKFGGELVCFGRNTCVHSPHLLQLSRLGYWAYQRLRRLLTLGPTANKRSQEVGQPAARAG